MYEFDGNHIQYLVQITFLYIASIIFMYILLVILYNHIMGREAIGNASVFGSLILQQVSVSA